MHAKRNIGGRSGPLTAAFVARVKRPARYSDGRGAFGLLLAVSVRAGGRIGKVWTQRVRIDGRVTNLGLGRFPVVSLRMAREAAIANMREIYLGNDPRRKVQSRSDPDVPRSGGPDLRLAVGAVAWGRDKQDKKIVARRDATLRLPEDWRKKD